MLSQAAKHAYSEWKITGSLIDNRDIVFELYQNFKAIANATVGIAKYESVYLDAVRELDRLKDIVTSRYPRSRDLLL